MSSFYFPYGQKEMDFLASKDKRLAEVIKRLGKINRVVIPDLFEALVHTIVGQQISSKAHASIWAKIKNTFSEVTPCLIADCPEETLKNVGLSYRKVRYIQSIARKIEDHSLNLEVLHDMSDKEVCTELTKLNGIGVWSAEMLMLFSMQRPNILSFGDFAIQKGLRILYHHKNITLPLFQKYHRRYSPYASVASIYLWEIAAGTIIEPRGNELALKKGNT